MKTVTSISYVNAKDIKSEGMIVYYNNLPYAVHAEFVITYNGKAYEVVGIEKTFTSLKDLKKYITDETTRMCNENEEQNIFSGDSKPRSAIGFSATEEPLHTSYNSTPIHEYKPKSSQWSAFFGSHDINYSLRQDAPHGYALTIYRQSGNAQYAYHCPTLGSAIGTMNKHLNRNSRMPFTITNSTNVLKLGLPHTGRTNEGKRIGSFEIIALEKPYDDWVDEKNMNNRLIQVGIFVLMCIIAFISAAT